MESLLLVLREEISAAERDGCEDPILLRSLCTAVRSLSESCAFLECSQALLPCWQVTTVTASDAFPIRLCLSSSSNPFVVSSLGTEVVQDVGSHP